MLTKLFEEEFQTIKEEAKDKIFEIAINYAAQRLLTTPGLIKSHTDFKLALNGISNYIEENIDNDPLFETVDIDNPEHVMQMSAKYTSLVEGIITAAKFLVDKGLDVKKLDNKLGIGIIISGSF
jgi:hypothetical protein